MGRSAPGVITGRSCETAYGFLRQPGRAGILPGLSSKIRGCPIVGEAVFTCLCNANMSMDISEQVRAPPLNIPVAAMDERIPDKAIFAGVRPFAELKGAPTTYEAFRSSRKCAKR